MDKPTAVFLAFLGTILCCFGAGWLLNKALWWIARKVESVFMPTKRAQDDLHETYRAKR